MARNRRSIDSNSSSTSSSPERELDDDNDSIMQHRNDSQSSLSVSLEEMEIDNVEEYERQQRLSPISRLPAELLIAIFSKLSSPQDIQNSMLVSKGWARNAVDLLWHRPSTNRWENLINVIQTTRKKDGFFAYHDLVKRLNLGQLKDDVSDGVLQPLSVCKRVERLTLPGCSQLTDVSLVPVIDGNRSLMALDVSDLELITDKTLFTVAKNCYRLQGLNISNCKGITDDSLSELAKCCRRLKRLKLNDCNQLTDLSIFAFADHCHDILEIDLFRCTNITDQAVTALIKEGKQLRELRLAQCFRITDEAFLQLPAEQTFEALRILDLTDCNELQDGGLAKIVQAAPRLRNLVLAKCRNITDRGVSAITKLGKNLHFLHLGHCANLTDVGVIQLVKHCNRIRYIDFSCCARLTDDSVQQLASLPKLKRIGLVKCNNITDASIQALARPKQSSTSVCCHPNNLERLHLSYCTQLTIPGIRTLLLNCPHLTHLSLTGVPPFLRDDILRFCREAPQEFNDHQRDVFCVFSGAKVEELRQHLKGMYPTPSPSISGLDEDAFVATFMGPSSAPTSGRFTGLSRPHDTLDLATPPPLPTPFAAHHPAALPPPPPRLPIHFDATLTPQNPPFNGQQIFTLTAPEPTQAQPSAPQPLFAGRSRTPTQASSGLHFNGVPGPSPGSQQSQQQTPPNMTGLPGSSRNPLQQAPGQAPLPPFTAAAATANPTATTSTSPTATPARRIFNHNLFRQHSPRRTYAQVAQTTGQSETPMALPSTPDTDDTGGVNL